MLITAAKIQIKFAESKTWTSFMPRILDSFHTYFFTRALLCLLMHVVYASLVEKIQFKSIGKSFAITFLENVYLAWSTAAFVWWVSCCTIFTAVQFAERNRTRHVENPNFWLGTTFITKTELARRKNLKQPGAWDWAFRICSITIDVCYSSWSLTKITSGVHCNL